MGELHDGLAFIWVATNIRSDAWSHVIGLSNGYDKETGAWACTDPLRVIFDLAPGTTCDLLCALSGSHVTEEEALLFVRGWSFESTPPTAEKGDNQLPLPPPPPGLHSMLSATQKKEFGNLLEAKMNSARAFRSGAFRSAASAPPVPALRELEVASVDSEDADGDIAWARPDAPDMALFEEMLACLEGGMDIIELNELVGFPLFHPAFHTREQAMMELRDLVGSGVTASLRPALPASDLQNSGVDMTLDLMRLGATDLLRAGSNVRAVDILSLKKAGFDAQRLRAAGFQRCFLRDVGFSDVDLALRLMLNCACCSHQWRPLSLLLKAAKHSTELDFDAKERGALVYHRKHHKEKQRRTAQQQRTAQEGRQQKRWRKHQHRPSKQRNRWRVECSAAPMSGRIFGRGCKGGTGAQWNNLLAWKHLEGGH